MGASLPVPSRGDTSTQGLIMSPGSDVEAADVPQLSRRQYQYPPPPGKKYFADNFKLGTKKFANLKLQSFLFGDSSDLNFLPSEPGPIPFKRAPDSVPLPAIHSSLNLRTDSIRLSELSSQTADADPAYSLQFEFDAETECQVCVLFSIPVEHSPSFIARENSARPELCSDTFSFPPGFKQRFSESSVQFCVPDLSTEFTFSPSSPTYPIIIKLQASLAVPGTNRLQRQTHTTILSLEAGASGYKPVVLKQRLTIDSLTFLLQEVYGLSRPGQGEGEADVASLSSRTSSSSLQLEPGEECIVCLAEAKDTLILPCRHLTTCAQCASSLKYQSKKCPVCRTEFQALLRIRPLLKSPTASPSLAVSGTYASDGYQHTSLFQAVHGLTSSDRNRPTHVANGSAAPSLPIQVELEMSTVPYPAMANTYSKPPLSPDDSATIPDST